MKKIKLHCISGSLTHTQLTRLLTILLLLGFISNRTFAAIPTSISTTITVSSPDQCNAGICTIHSSGILIVTSTATFDYDIIVEPGGQLIVNSGTVKMPQNGRIRLLGQTGLTIYTGGKLIATGTSTSNAVFTCTNASSGQFWAGIETDRGNSLSGGVQPSSAVLSDTRIEYATNALSNYNSDYAPSATAGGKLLATDVVFLNNLRSARVYWSNYTTTSSGPDPWDNLVNLMVKFIRCTFEFQTPFTPDPPDMVVLNNCRGISFQSCEFRGKNNYYAFTTGISAVQSGVRIEKAPGSSTGCLFYNIKQGITVMNTFQPDKRVIIRNSLFNCQNGVNLQGCLNPLVVADTFKPNNNLTSCGLYLSGTTGYRVEANLFENLNAGIVARNTGVAENELYRNRVKDCVLGIQSFGNNKSANGNTGLRILCNNITANYVSNAYDISVVQDPAVGNNGISNSQFASAPSSSALFSAANQFSISGNTGLPYNYFVAPSTNDLSQLTYRYYSPTAAENPVYRSNIVLLTGIYNYCRIHNYGGPMPPYPFSAYASQLQNIEQNITDLENIVSPTSDDSAALDYNINGQAALIDSAFIHYQDVGETDSAILVLEQVTKGYHYKVILAMAYVNRLRFTDALTLIANIPVNYTLTDEEAIQLDNLYHVYEAMYWLSENDDDWANLPSEYYDAITVNAGLDYLYAGAVARSLLTRYEGAEYGPEFVIPEPEELISKIIYLARQQNIYPNPAKDKLYFKNLKGILILCDITGKQLYSETITQDFAVVNIGNLFTGIYIAQVMRDGHIIYKQKIVKN